MPYTMKRTWFTEKRKAKGWSQTELGFHAHISASYVQAIEYGERRPTVPIAQVLGKLLDFDWTLFYPPVDDTTSARKSSA